MSGSVLLAVAGSVAQVTLSNPGKLNAMSRAMWQGLRDVFTGIGQQPQLRCVQLQGLQGDFCAGGDISEYPDFRFDEASLRDFHEREVWGGLKAVLNCDLPVVARIEGNCMGAGLEIASCCDIRIASEGARFGAPIAKLGFPMAPREAALLLGAVGELTAREMLLCASIFDAAEMKHRGFLNQVEESAALAEAVHACTTRICSLAPAAARLNKQSFRALAPIKRAEIATDLIANAYRYADSAEHREGITAFIKKRPPQF